MKKRLITLVLFINVFACFAQQAIELNNWKFATGDNVEWAKPGFDDLLWKPIKAGNAWEYQGVSGYDGYAWYRIRFTLSSGLKKDAALKDSILFDLGMMDRDQTFLNGRLIGQNSICCKDKACLVPATLTDLSKTDGEWTTDRNYTLSVNDQRLNWDKENVLAIRIFDVGSVGGLMSSPLKVKMKDKTDYLAFDLNAKPWKTKPDGTVTKTITLKNSYPKPEIKGTLTVEIKNGGNKPVTTKTWNVDMKKEAMFELSFKGDTTLREKATCTFVESKTGNRVVYAQESDCSGGWSKYKGSPVLGGNLGTIFDISVLKNDAGVYQMYCSWRDKKSIALSESKDGLHWSEPVVCLAYIDNSDWEPVVNRPVVIQKDGLYHMWYTGQVWVQDEKDHSWSGRSCIGYALSTDGKNFTRKSDKPVFFPDMPWEKTAVMCPHVLWDGSEKLFKMWYSAGEQYEPDAIGYATSKDGMHWDKFKNNPVFSNNKQNEWEQAKVTACQVIKRKNDYLMLYIGFKNVDYAQIGLARSKDGITNWERYNENPIIKPGLGWDAEATYKPYAVPDNANNRWLLYYNGRREWHEQIGVAIHEGMDFGF